MKICSQDDPCSDLDRVNLCHVIYLPRDLITTFLSHLLLRPCQTVSDMFKSFSARRAIVVGNDDERTEPFCHDNRRSIYAISRRCLDSASTLCIRATTNSAAQQHRRIVRPEPSSLYSMKCAQAVARRTRRFRWRIREEQCSR